WWSPTIWTPPRSPTAWCGWNTAGPWRKTATPHPLRAREACVLHSPDLRLVERDPALPGLAILLDATRLSAWVTELLGRPVRVRRRYLRYKHGTSCVLYAAADGLPLLISALRPAWPEKHQKLIERAGAAVLGQDPARGALIATPSADRHLR